ncbi:MAG: hypothetical protein ABI810_10395 [Sphingomonas bacterium]
MRAGCVGGLKPNAFRGARRVTAVTLIAAVTVIARAALTAPAQFREASRMMAALPTANPKQSVRRISGFDCLFATYIAKQFPARERAVFIEFEKALTQFGTKI